MSQNLHITDINDDSPTLVKTRFNVGITNSAKIHDGDWVRISNSIIKAQVVEIEHIWQKPDGDIAPCTIIRAVVNRELDEGEWDYLYHLGFSELIIAPHKIP